MEFKVNWLGKQVYKVCSVQRQIIAVTCAASAASRAQLRLLKHPVLVKVKWVSFPEYFSSFSLCLSPSLTGKLLELASWTLKIQILISKYLQISVNFQPQGNPGWICGSWMLISRKKDNEFENLVSNVLAKGKPCYTLSSSLLPHKLPLGHQNPRPLVPER